MSAPIDFYFDFSSPYGYLAAQKIDALAARYGRTVRWRPILLGVAFKATGARPLPQLPVKGPYFERDFARSARFHGIAYRRPSVFPVSSVSALRAFYWMAERDPGTAVELAKAVFQAYFVEDRNISDREVVATIAMSIGLDAQAVRAAMNDEAIKDRARAEVDGAVARGIFGSPYIVVDGEPFWGMDRLEQVERWLASGPF